MKKLTTIALTAALAISLTVPALANTNPNGHVQQQVQQAVAHAIQTGDLQPLEDLCDDGVQDACQAIAILTGSNGAQ